MEVVERAHNGEDMAGMEGDCIDNCVTTLYVAFGLCVRVPVGIILLINLLLGYVIWWPMTMLAGCIITALLIIRLPFIACCEDKDMFKRKARIAFDCTTIREVVTAFHEDAVLAYTRIIPWSLLQEGWENHYGNQDEANLPIRVGPFGAVGVVFARCFAVMLCRNNLQDEEHWFESKHMFAVYKTLACIFVFIAIGLSTIPGIRELVLVILFMFHVYMLYRSDLLWDDEKGQMTYTELVVRPSISIEP
jgi:hypothetical protein